MDKLEALAGAHGWEKVEAVAWEWAGQLDLGTRVGVELALAVDGLDGLGDLLVAGPAFGGLDEGEVVALVAAVESVLGEPLAA